MMIILYVIIRIRSIPLIIILIKVGMMVIFCDHGNQVSIDEALKEIEA